MTLLPEEAKLSLLSSIHKAFVVIFSIRYTQYLGRSIIRVVVATLNTLSLMSKTCNESQPVNRRPQLMKLWQVTRGVLYCFSYEIKDKAWSKFSIHYHHMIFLLEVAKLLLLSSIHKACRHHQHQIYTILKPMFVCLTKRTFKRCRM